jgi:hypothetical protein
MKNDICDNSVFVPDKLSDVVMLAGMRWHRDLEGRIYTNLKGKKIFLDEEILNKDDDEWTEHSGADDLFPGFELPLVDSQGNSLENTFAIVPVQYLEWLESVGPWYLDEQSNSIYTRISEDPRDRVYLRDVVWTRMATDCFV